MKRGDQDGPSHDEPFGGGDDRRNRDPAGAVDRPPAQNNLPEFVGCGAAAAVGAGVGAGAGAASTFAPQFVQKS